MHTSIEMLRMADMFKLIFYPGQPKKAHTHTHKDNHNVHKLYRRASLVGVWWDDVLCFSY